MASKIVSEGGARPGLNPCKTSSEGFRHKDAFVMLPLASSISSGLIWPNNLMTFSQRFEEDSSCFPMSCCNSRRRCRRARICSGVHRPNSWMTFSQRFAEDSSSSSVFPLSCCNNTRHLALAARNSSGAHSFNSSMTFSRRFVEDSSSFAMGCCKSMKR